MNPEVTNGNGVESHIPTFGRHCSGQQIPDSKLSFSPTRFALDTKITIIRMQDWMLVFRECRALTFVNYPETKGWSRQLLETVQDI